MGKTLFKAAQKVAVGVVGMATLGVGVVLAPTAASAATASQIRAAIVNQAQDQIGGHACDPGYYNSCGMEWCAEFARWVWRHGGVTDYAGLDGYAQSFKEYGTERGLFHSRTSGYNPQPGDAVVFDWDHDPGDNHPIDHVAIVESVSGGQVHIIGGNQGSSDNNSSSVSRRDYSLSDGDITGYTEPKLPEHTHKVVNDFDRDGASDLALFRPSAGLWNVKSVDRSVQLYGSYEYGGGDDTALTGDFDNDGYADIALFRPSVGEWNIKSPHRNVQIVAQYGYGGGDDTPLTGDFDGDGYTDIALFRPSTREWNIKSVHRNVQIVAQYAYGGNGDIPLAGDFDNDGTDDIALFRPSDRSWHVKSVSRNVQLYGGDKYGAAGDVPMTGDFDNDGYADIAVFTPSTGHWNVKSLHRGVQIVAQYLYGGGSDIPVTGDYDGDGYTDIALFRPSVGEWNVKSLHRNVQIVAQYPYGGGQDLPVTTIGTQS
jgi:hypothetical protein